MALPDAARARRFVTPDRLLVREQVDEVEIPGAEGYFGVLPGHTPMLAALAVGEMWYRKGAGEDLPVIAYGFVEVLPDRVTILAQLAERAEEIDVGAGRRSEEARRGATGRRRRTSITIARARRSQKSLARLQVASRAASAAASARQRMPPPQG